MSVGDGLMQIISLDPNLIEYEILKAGLKPEEAAAFVHKEITRSFKLYLIPGNLISPLITIFSKHKIASLTYGYQLQNPATQNLIIAGTITALRRASEELASAGKELAPVSNLITKRLTALTEIKTAELKIGDRIFKLGRRTYLMGILNVTPDSFSDGGQFDTIDKAIEHAYVMADEGADIIDIGGESTRPGHFQIPAEEELKRVLPIIEILKKDPTFNLPLSIDTYKASVAEAALKAGADMLNDVWGLKADAELATVASRFQVPVCLMHNRNSTKYDDLMAEILTELEQSVNLALNAGIDSKNIIVDPGIGFGKDLQQNLEVMLHLNDFANLGYPLLLGTSRKSMIGKTLDLPVEERLEGTAATVAYGISAGADLVRVHDVKAMKRVIDMTDAMIRR